MILGMIVIIGGDIVQVVYIQYPHVYTDDGQRIQIENIEGHPKIGSELINAPVTFDKLWIVQAVTSDSECVSGVCPIK
jgi:hypothetical protein